MSSCKTIQLTQFISLKKRPATPTVHLKISKPRHGRAFVHPDYAPLGRLGKGAYGDVIKAIHLKTQVHVAIKRALREATATESSQDDEIAMLKALIHPNIIKCEEVLMPDKDIVLELCRMTLGDYIDSKVDVVPVKRLIQQMCLGVKFIHEMGRAHFDLKPGNILLTSDHVIKIADFGCSRDMVEDVRPLEVKVGTLPYCAPEILLTEGGYSCMVDVWSLALCIYELVIKDRLFAFAMDDMEQLQEIFTIFGTPDTSTWKHSEEYFYPLPSTLQIPQNIQRHDHSFSSLDNDLRDLCLKMLTMNQMDRIEMEDVIRHRFIK